MTRRGIIVIDMASVLLLVFSSQLQPLSHAGLILGLETTLLIILALRIIYQRTKIVICELSVNIFSFKGSFTFQIFVYWQRIAAPDLLMVPW